MYYGFCLTCELPHFYDDKIMDKSPTGSRRRDLLLESLKIEAGTYDPVKRVFEETHGLLDVNSRIYRSIRYFLDRWVEAEQTTRAYSQDPAFDRPATVAEAKKLRSLRDAVHARLLQLNSNIRQESNPQAIPIEKLVRIQLQSAIVCLTHLDSNRS